MVDRSMGILITYNDYSEEVRQHIVTLVEELLTSEPGTAISIMPESNSPAERDLSSLRKNNLGFIDETALPQTVEEVDKFVQICKHNKKHAARLIKETEPKSRGTRRSRRIASKHL